MRTRTVPRRRRGPPPRRPRRRTLPPLLPPPLPLPPPPPLPPLPPPPPPHPGPTPLPARRPPWTSPQTPSGGWAAARRSSPPGGMVVPWSSMRLARTGCRRRRTLAVAPPAGRGGGAVRVTARGPRQWRRPFVAAAAAAAALGGGGEQGGPQPQQVRQQLRFRASPRGWTAAGGLCRRCMAPSPAATAWTRRVAGEHAPGRGWRPEAGGVGERRRMTREASTVQTRSTASTAPRVGGWVGRCRGGSSAVRGGTCEREGKSVAGIGGTEDSCGVCQQ